MFKRKGKNTIIRCPLFFRFFRCPDSKIGVCLYLQTPIYKIKEPQGTLSGFIDAFNDIDED